MSERQHGTRTKYALDHCKCLKCRAANAQYEQGYRWRRLTAREDRQEQPEYAPIVREPDPQNR